jgi:hypothetical protein
MAKSVEISSPAQLSSLLSSARVVVINCEGAYLRAQTGVANVC